MLARWIAWRDADRETPRQRRELPLDHPDSPWRLYRVSPARLYALEPVGSDGGQSGDPRVPVDLTESFARAYRSRGATTST